MYAHLVDERQHGLGSVLKTSLHFLEVAWQLQDALHERLGGFRYLFDFVAQQRLCELFEVIGQQGDALQLQHDQRPMYLVQTGQASANASRVLPGPGIFLEGRTRRYERV